MNRTPSSSKRTARRRSPRGVLVLSLAVALLAVCAASASATPPAGFVGMQSWNDPTSNQVNALKSARVKTFRVQLAWTSVEPYRPKRGRDQYRWGRYDKMFGRLGAAGIRPMPVLLGSPDWALSGSQEKKPQNPPMGTANRQAFYDFARAAARRYGPNSSFWKARRLNGSVVGVRHFQVWNEVNLKNYWNNRPSPSEYASMVKGTYQGVKAGDSASTTILAGMPWSTSAQSPPEFWRGMYQTRPDVYKYFSAGAIHPYGKTPSESINLIRSASSSLRRLPGSSGRNVWVTEIGWATGTPDGRFQVSEATQARNLELFYDELERIKDGFKVSGAVWFNLVDRSGGNFWYNRTGLIRTNRTYKPSWYRLKCVTGAPGCDR